MPRKSRSVSAGARPPVVTEPPSSPCRRHRPQFGTRGLLLIMVVAGISSAAVASLVRATRFGDRGAHLRFLLLLLAGPLVLVVLIAGVMRLAEHRRRDDDRERDSR